MTYPRGNCRSSLNAESKEMSSPRSWQDLDIGRILDNSGRASGWLNRSKLSCKQTLKRDRRRPSLVLAPMVSSPFARRRGSRAPEGLCKVALVGKSQSYRDVSEAECSAQQQRLRMLHAGIQEPAIGRDAHGRSERARKL